MVNQIKLFNEKNKLFVKVIEDLLKSNQTLLAKLKSASSESSLVTLSPKLEKKEGEFANLSLGSNAKIVKCVKTKNTNILKTLASNSQADQKQHLHSNHHENDKNPFHRPYNMAKKVNDDEVRDHEQEDSLARLSNNSNYSRVGASEIQANQDGALLANQLRYFHEIQEYIVKSFQDNVKMKKHMDKLLTDFIELIKSHDGKMKQEVSRTYVIFLFKGIYSWY